MAIVQLLLHSNEAGIFVVYGRAAALADAPLP